MPVHDLTVCIQTGSFVLIRMSPRSFVQGSPLALIIYLLAIVVSFFQEGRSPGLQYMQKRILISAASSRFFTVKYIIGSSLATSFKKLGRGRSP